MKVYNYFVSYRIEGFRELSKFGNCVISRKKKISNYSDIKKVQEEIKGFDSSHNLTAVIVLFYKEF